MMPRFAGCTPRTRPVRANMGQPRLESLAAEFALLVQRRSRAIHELDLLDRQRANAAAILLKLQSRISYIMAQMDAIGPDLRTSGPQQSVSSAHAPLGRTLTPADTLAEIGRQWLAAQAVRPDQPAKLRRSKRP